MLRDLLLEADGRRVPLVLTGTQFSPWPELRAGAGVIRLALAAPVALDAPGEHRLAFRNDHLPEIGAYIANALVPALPAITITSQTRDPLQHSLRVDFLVRARPRPWLPWTAGALAGLCATWLWRARRVGPQDAT